MKTEELISSLASDLVPIPPLPSPVWRAARWLFGAVLYLAALTFAMTGFSIAIDGTNVAFLTVQLVGIVAGVLAAIAAFASVVPGYSSRMVLWSAIAAGGWLALLVFSSLVESEGRAVLAARDEWVCVAVILVGGSPLVAALSFMLKRGAPLNPITTAVLGALAVGLLANFSACISRPHAANAATLLWHVGAVVALMLACIAGARLVLTWKRQGNR